MAVLCSFRIISHYDKEMTKIRTIFEYLSFLHVNGRIHKIYVLPIQLLPKQLDSLAVTIKVKYPKRAANSPYFHVNLRIFLTFWTFAHLNIPENPCMMGVRKGSGDMFRKKRYIYLSDDELRCLVYSLVQLRNKLLAQGRYTDCVDELLVKVMDSPIKKVCT